MPDTATLNDIEHSQTLTRAWLEAWVADNEKPAWFDWFGLYPAKASVDAAKTTLNAMNDYDLIVSTRDSFGIFNG